MTRLVFIGLLIIGWLAKGQGQQLPQYSQYMTNQYAYNPAFGGMERSLSITGMVRSQWSQFPESPKTQMIYGHLPLYFLEGAAGFRLVNEQLGQSNRLQVDASYNYVRQIGRGLYSAGVRVGFQQFSLDNNVLRTPDGSYIDNQINHNDPLLNGALSSILPSVGIGIYGMLDGLQVGVSIENLLSTSVNSPSYTYSSSGHLNVFLSYNYVYTQELSVRPSLLYKSDGVSSQVDFGALVEYNNLMGGFSIRDPFSLESVAIITGVSLSEHFKVYYSFDIGLSGLRTFHDGTHEFSINYNLNKPIRTGELPNIIYNPRFN